MSPAELDVFNCPLDGVQLIEASAGTGKTWNICGLYLRLLLEQQRTVRQILVVTFTNAATAELRERIRVRLLDLSRALEGDTASGHDPFVRQFIASVLDGGRVDRAAAADLVKLALLSFDEAAIFTIHGFCQRALADTPFAAALPFRFELVPDDRELKREVAADYWRRTVVHGTLQREFVACLVKGGPDWLAKHLHQRLRKPLAELVWPDFGGVGNPGQTSAELQRLFLEAGELWRRQADAIVRTVLDGLPHLNGVTYKEEAVLLAGARWSEFFHLQNPAAAFADKQNLLTSGTLEARTKKNCATPQHPFFMQAQALLESNEALQAELQLLRLQLLRDWLEQAPGELAKRKQARRIVSFDDLLGNLHRALTGGDYPWLAAAIRQRFPCALIDEFQDTDPLQFGIFRHIYAADETPSPLCLVGDPKQAIYSFRSADLHTYLQARADATRLHTLSANQRSCQGLIKACNALFGANGRAFVLDGLEYQNVSHGDKPRAPFNDETEPRGDLELWLLPHDEAGAPRRKGELQTQVAGTCAAEIARLLNAAGEGRVLIDGRALRASDIAVVVRSHSQGSRMRRALAALGVSSVELSQQSIFATEQAEEVERILLAVADPAHAGLLKAALATEVMGQDGAAIWALREDEARFAGWLEVFQGYRRLWLEHGFSTLWQTLLREQHTAPRLLTGPDGERKMTNLMHLGELLASATPARSGMESLLRWLADKRLDGGVDEVAQLRLESDENLVQILTIHKSKGLEYPIVFCPCLWESAGFNAGNGECIGYHRGAVQVLDFSLDPKAREDARRAAELEDAAEQIRLIYVALTRAVHRCYLVAGNYALVRGRSVSFSESGHSALNWLAAGAGGDYGQWLARDVTPEEVTCAWNRLAAATAGIRLEVLPAIPPVCVRPESQDGESFKAREIARLPQESWRLGSFSALSRGVVPEQPAADRDALPESSSLEPDGESGIAADDILGFPRGEQAGHCLHRAFELADFTDAGSWPAAISQALTEYPQHNAQLPADQLAAMMNHLVRDVVATPLRPGLTLDGVSTARRLSELEFCFPVGQLTPGRLQRWLEGRGYGHLKLGFAPFSGYLKGFIDLVFESGGRYYLLDWKSNHLGPEPEDYGPAGVSRAMDQHGYHLQSLCYTLALHRHLRQRLPRYCYETHFGGCLYLFLRGVRPGWRNPDGTASGVFFHRPQPLFIEELEHLFSAGARGATA